MGLYYGDEREKEGANRREERRREEEGREGERKERVRMALNIFES